MSTLCDASERRLAHDAEKVAEHLKEGKQIFKCKGCHRLSHKADHLCKPVAVNVVVGVAPAVKAEDRGEAEDGLAADGEATE